MNKEAKAIVDYLEEEREAIRTLCYFPDDVLSCEDLIMLMDYINQLETNIDEALKRNEQVLKMIEDGRSREQFLPYLKNQKKLLERGKE